MDSVITKETRADMGGKGMKSNEMERNDNNDDEEDNVMFR